METSAEPQRGHARSALALVAAYAVREVSDHPFFRRLRANPVDMGALWTLVANLQAGISAEFIRWLATTISRVDDRRIAALLAKQLSDELGNGDFEMVHSKLLERFVAGLAPWRPAGTDQRLLQAGRRLARRGRRPFHAVDPYQGVGALMVGEIFAEKMDACLGNEIRRQNAISDHALTWLTIHEKLEVDHADDSEALAALIPTAGVHVRSVWQGATAQWRVLWEFLDDIDELTRPASARSPTRRPRIMLRPRRPSRQADAI